MIISCGSVSRIVDEPIHHQLIVVSDDVSVLRDPLRAEFTVFGHHADAAQLQNEVA